MYLVYTCSSYAVMCAWVSYNIGGMCWYGLSLKRATPIYLSLCCHRYGCACNVCHMYVCACEWVHMLIKSVLAYIAPQCHSTKMHMHTIVYQTHCYIKYWMMLQTWVMMYSVCLHYIHRDIILYSLPIAIAMLPGIIIIVIKLTCTFLAHKIAICMFTPSLDIT